MIFGMTTPVPNAAMGSVGTVDTQYLDLPRPVALDCGRALHPVRVAFETYGTLSPARDNVILVCHALSGDAHGPARRGPRPARAPATGSAPRSATAAARAGWAGGTA